MIDNQMDFIESSLYYSLYLAENDFMRQLAVIDNKAKYVTEASNYKILNEALLDTIRQFFTRLVKAIGDAFNKFKETMASEKAMSDVLNLINKNKNLLSGDFRLQLPDNFEYPNIDNWNKLFDSINTDIQNKEFTKQNYDSWKSANALESPDAFIKHEFNSLSSINNDNLLDGMHNLIFGNTKNEKGAIVASDKAQVYADFLTNYKSQVDNISKQIDSINKSIKNIDSYLQTIKGTNESYLGLNRALSILNEEDYSATSSTPQQNQSQPAPSVDTSTNNNANDTFRDADNPNGDQNKNNDAQDRKFITHYAQAITKVLQTEMQLSNQIRVNCIKIVSNYINMYLKKNGNTQNNTNNEQQNQQQNTGNDNGPAQVNNKT